MGKLGKAASLEGFILTMPSLLEGQSAFNVHFDYSDEIGVPGAFVIRNNLSTEFFLVSLTLDDIPNHGTVHFVCNSWVYPDAKYKSSRIFFSNKVCQILKPNFIIENRLCHLIKLRNGRHICQVKRQQRYGNTENKS